ncbi:MAG: hypothetical protein ACOYK9_04820 [Chlamydiia bacterium]
MHASPLEFISNTDTSIFNIECLTKKSLKLKLFQDELSEESYNACIESKTDRGEALLSKDNRVLCILVYASTLKTDLRLKDQNFCITECKILESTSENRSLLLSRITTIAESLHAQGISINEPRDRALSRLFEQSGYKLYKKDGDSTSCYFYKSLISSVSHFNGAAATKRKELDSSREGDRAQKTSRAPSIYSQARPIPRTYSLPMNGSIYLEYIMSGKKKFEGRVNRTVASQVHVGDTLDLCDHKARWGILCEVVSKDWYQTFDEMLQEKGVLSMLPQLEQKARTLAPEELIKAGAQIYKNFNGSHEVAKVGAVAIGVKFIRKYQK